MYEIFGNTYAEYTRAFLAFILFYAIFYAGQKLLLNRLEKLARRTKTDIDDAVIDIARSLRPPFYFFLAFYLAFNFLSASEFVSKIINSILIIWVIYQIAVAFQILINHLTKYWIKKHGEDSARSSVEWLGKLAKSLIWMVGILVVLSNLGVNISAVLAGFGIGGVAVAIALQNILGDLFSSFAIHFDKPFVVGDFIVVGDKMGVVEKIGIKTTRIRALQGEEIIIANSVLTSAQIQNFKRMKERRAAFKFGVVYEIPSQKLKKIPEMIKKIIESVDLTRFDRVSFIKFGDSALDFEVIYYVQTSDFNKYMDIQQEINMNIKNVFEKEGIEMAYPTRTVYVKK